MHGNIKVQLHEPILIFSISFSKLEKEKGSVSFSHINSVQYLISNQGPISIPPESVSKAMTL